MVLAGKTRFKESFSPPRGTYGQWKCRSEELNVTRLKSEIYWIWPDEKEKGSKQIFQFRSRDKSVERDQELYFLLTGFDKQRQSEISIHRRHLRLCKSSSGDEERRHGVVVRSKTIRQSQPPISSLHVHTFQPHKTNSYAK